MPGASLEAKPKLFISYSRRQTPFVDRLAGELENAGYAVWLDYKSLVPARPWTQQLEAGIEISDAILLNWVVNRLSIRREPALRERRIHTLKVPKTR